MTRKPISKNLYYWLQIVEGLSTDEILQIAQSGSVKALEEACTAIATVMEKRCSMRNKLN